MKPIQNTFINMGSPPRARDQGAGMWGDRVPASASPDFCLFLWFFLDTTLDYFSLHLHVSPLRAEPQCPHLDINSNIFIMFSDYWV